MNQTAKTILSIIAIIIVVVGLGLILRHAGHRSETAVSNDSATSTLTANSGSSASTAMTASSATATTTMDQHYTQATLKTNFGDITIAFDPSIAPNTVANFIKLASSGFYDSTKFHRVIAGFMIQGGDPLSKDDSQEARWGTGGPGYQFNDEITADSHNVPGAVAMANSGPNTNGSQFFINVANNAFLDGHYSVFAHVTSGYDVAEKISTVKTDSSDRPVSPVILESVTLK